MAIEANAERADVLAYLRARRAAAMTVARHNAVESDRATEVARSIAIEIEFIEQGLHEGSALVATEMSMGVYDG